MGERIPLKQKELQEQLAIQLKLLRKSCENFDHGDELEALHISVSLRLLWHNKGKQKGLVSQLNLVNEVLDTAFLVPPTFITEGIPEPPSDEYRLFAIGGSRAYKPLFDNGPAGIFKTPFEQWWKGNVLSDIEKHKFTREDLVLEVAETDGGAHVDPALTPSYYALTRKETFGWIRAVETKDPKVFERIKTPSPVYVILRQIGHETLRTLCHWYKYDGSLFYPGGALNYISATITPSPNDKTISK
jgi:hypothetical protein